MAETDVNVCVTSVGDIEITDAACGDKATVLALLVTVTTSDLVHVES